MTSPSPKVHPIISLSSPRAKAWEEVATDEDFYRYIDGLANIYAKRLYDKDASGHKRFADYEPRLLEDFNKWKESTPW